MALETLSRGEPFEAGGEAEAKSRLSSVAMAIRLLKAFSEDEVEIGVSALAQKLGLAKSTVHRLAATLVSEGMLEKNPETEKYRLGIALFGLGTLVRRRMNLSEEARPYLFELREKTHETVLLGILADADVMYIYNLESPQAIRMRSDIGVRRPAFCTAVGRAILAFQPEAVVERVLAAPLRPRTARTVTDPEAVRRLLGQARQAGYAIEDEESEVGMRAVAAPVLNAAGAVAGAVGVAGPAQRLSLKALQRIAVPLLEATGAIARRLGHRATASV